MKVNPLTCIDFYKADHRRQYPAGTELVYSNFTPRSVKRALTVPGLDDQVVFFGLQYFIKYFLQETFQREFFDLSRDYVVAKYNRRMDCALGKDAIPVDHIEALHDLGYLPISIRALPEGSVSPAGVPLLTIENTLPEFFWLTNYLETIISCMLWKPCTSATTARKYRMLLEQHAKATGADLEAVKFQAHDFSFRGTSGIQDAVMSGAGHLLSFVGTDTVAAIDFLEDYYNADCERELVGCSVPATEHSVMCMGGATGEFETFKRLITEQYPSGIVSIVSDTWDFWKVITEYLPRLRPEIMARDGKVVIRPDSGDPVKIICGDKDLNHFGPEYLGAVQCLWNTFGGDTNREGYSELDPHIGLIYGDSITLNRADEICSRLRDMRFASTSTNFGVGSFTYEYVTRDTLGFAMKATAGIVNGEQRDIYKDPKTDTDKLKKSARGFLCVETGLDGRLSLMDQVRREWVPVGALKEVYRDGVLLRETSLSEIRNRLYPVAELAVTG